MNDTRDLQKTDTKTDTKSTSLVPDFMTDDATEGTELLSNFIRPPIVKIIQGSSDSDFASGSVILAALDKLVAEPDQPFIVTPLFFFADWRTWNPLKLRQSMPMFHETSTDPESDLAAKCRNQDTWFEVIPGNEQSEAGDRNYMRRNVEGLNFLCRIHGIEGLEETPVLFPFFKGEWSTGSQWCGKIKLRRAPIYGCNFQLQSVEHENANGETWFGFDICNPDNASPMELNEEQYFKNKALHETLKGAVIKADIEDTDDIKPTANSKEY